MTFNKNDFTFLKNKNLIYFDSASTSIRPKQVIKAIANYYTVYSTNPHNSDSKLGYNLIQRITNCRTKIKNFINAESSNEIIFFPSTTYAINQISYGLINKLNKDDEIVLTEYEHASNFLPWIRLAKMKNCKINFFKMKNNLIDIKRIKEVITNKTKIVSFAPNSNTFGYFNNPEKIIKEIRKINKDIFILLDAAQTITHQEIDVQKFDVDFLVFSAHKMFGPTGIGILYGKYDKLNILDPLVLGGGTAGELNKNNILEFEYNRLPDKLEGGTPNASGILGLEAAIDYINDNGGVKVIHNHLIELRKYIIQQMDIHLKDRIIIYNSEYDSAILLFNIKGVFSQDVASFLGLEKNIIVRAGQHCNKLLENLIKEKYSLRISFSIFNTKQEIDKLIKILKNEKDFLGKLV